MGNTSNNFPEYSKYTIEELKEVLAHMDKVAYPERYEAATIALQEKLQEQPKSPEQTVKEEPAHLKWSERHISSKLASGLLLFLVATTMPTFAFEFMVAKNWTENTSFIFWLITLAVCALWFVALNHDKQYSKKLESTWRGKLSIVAMPFIYMVLILGFVDQTIPLALHKVSSQNKVQLEMAYEKKRGRKFCRYKIELLETKELEEVDLCLRQSQLERLPEKGKIRIKGWQSSFGLAIENL